MVCDVIGVAEDEKSGFDRQILEEKNTETIQSLNSMSLFAFNDYDDD